VLRHNHPSTEQQVQSEMQTADEAHWIQTMQSKGGLPYAMRLTGNETTTHICTLKKACRVMYLMAKKRLALFEFKSLAFFNDIA